MNLQFSRPDRRPDLISHHHSPAPLASPASDAAAMAAAAAAAGAALPSLSASSCSSSPSPAAPSPSPLLIPALHLLKQQQQQHQRQHQHQHQHQQQQLQQQQHHHPLHQAFLAMPGHSQQQNGPAFSPRIATASSCTSASPALNPPSSMISRLPCSSSSSSPSPLPFDQYASLISRKIQAQRQQVLSRSLKHRNYPLSPQESSTNLSSDPSASPYPRVEHHRFAQSEPCVQSQPSAAATAASLNADSYRAAAAPFVHSRDVQLSDLPIVRGAAAFQTAPAATRASTPSPASAPISVAAPAAAVGSPMQSTASNHHSGFHRMDADPRPPEESKRLKRTLKDLERELLEDDADIASSSVFDAQLPIIPIPSEPPERNWADVFEDFLSAEISAESSSLPAQTIEQSTITCSSSKIDEARTPKFPTLQPDSSAQLKDLLLSCAKAIDEGHLSLASSKVACLEQSVSTYGDPMQRLAAYMADGLAIRIEGLKGTGGCSRLSKFKEPSPAEVMRATQSLYRNCPYFIFGYMAANGVIIDAFRSEPKVHIIDFEIRQGNQWSFLINAFGQRPGGPPQVRLTGVANSKCPTSLEGVGQRLREAAQQAGVPFEFKALEVEASQVQPWMLNRKPDEALAVNFAFQLHHMPDESVSTSNPRDSLLRMVRDMEPKVVTLVELEANTNTAPFYPRFVETLSYFGAVFESLDVPLPRDSKERVNVEQHCLARHIVNIIACEGAARVERYELAGKWRARMSMAGFRALPLSSSVGNTTKEILRQRYSDKYRMRNESGALYLDWLDRALVVASAWQ